MVGVIMKFPSVLVYHAVVSSVDPSGGGLVSIGVDLPDYLDDVGVLGFIVYYSSLTGMFTVWCGLRYACFGFDDDLLVNYSCSADSFGFYRDWEKIGRAHV